VRWKTTLVGCLMVAAALSPGRAAAFCAVEGKLELVRLSLDESVAFVVQIRQPRAVVPNFFHVERTPNSGLGDIPAVIQLLSLANPATTTIAAVGDLAVCPDAAAMERARVENKGVFSGRLLQVFVKYR
jgi:hypothetical protein